MKLILFFMCALFINAKAVASPDNMQTVQGITVTGTVVDDLGVPLPGVNVTVKGSNIGVVSDGNGKYTITAPNRDAVLLFSYIGYATQEITVGDNKTIDVAMREGTQEIEEVVVVGYGTVKKSDLTGSVSSISSRTFMEQSGSSDVSVLAGRAAGVTVRKSDGGPDGDVLIRVRGTNSLRGSNAPLIVVDGNYGSLPDMYDIESIEILKDASATAIYGSRGANGVILVTTKRGTRETKPTARVYANFSFNNIPQRYDLMNAYEFAEFNNSAGAYPFTSQQIESFKNDKGTDWQDVLFRTGASQSYKAILSGGSKNVRYYVSPNWRNTTGVVKNTEAGRYGLNVKIDMDLNERILLQVESDLGHGDNLNRGMLQGGSKTSIPLMSALAWSPTEPVYDEDGKFHRLGIGSGTALNPLLLTTIENRSYRNSGNAVANLRIKLIDGLTFDAKGFMAYGMGGERRFESLELVGSATRARQNTYESKTWLLNTVLTYTKTFAKLHQFSVMAGFEETKSESQSFEANANNLPLESVKWYNLALSAPDIGVNSGYGNEAMRSFFGRVNYNYANRYLITANIRSDGSSKFKGDNQFSTFPSVALAWRISEEGFMKDQEAIQNLKLRGGWGVSGSQAIDRYATYSTLQRETHTWGDVDYPGYRARTGGNPNLKWESTKQSAFGIDVTTLSGRLSLSLDYYDKKTVDLLAPVAVPAYNGGGNVISNVGAVQNRGFEANLNYDVLRTKNYVYDINLNGSINRNKVLDIGEQDRLYGDTYAAGFGTVSPFVLIPGHPIGSVYGLKCLGIWQQNEADEAAKFGLQPGDYKFEEVVVDGKIDAEDYQIIGCANPKFTWGFNNHLTYRNFDVNVLFEGVHGRDVMNWTYFVATERYDFASTYTHRAARDRWTPENTNAEFARIGNTNVTPQSSHYLQNGSYVKLRNISVAYRVPKSKVSFAGIKVSASVQNLLTITKYKGYDPEISSSANDASSGMDWFAYPNARSVSFGIALEY